MKINVKKTNSLRIGIIEEEKETLGKKISIMRTASQNFVALAVTLVGVVKMLKVE